MWTPSFLHGRAAALLVALAFFVVVAIPAYIYFSPMDSNYLEAALRKVRFYPITPPTTLRAPGTIYVVSGDGQPISALCEASSTRLKDIVHESATETQIAQALRNASFSADAAVEQTIKARVKSDIVESVKFTLEDVSVLEVSIANLRTLAAELQKDAACADSIIEYLTAGEYICQGQQVLKATTKYSIQTKRTAAGSAATELRDAVRATIDPNAAVDGSTITTGIGLYYGMRLAPRCMALPGHRIERPPITWFNKILNFIEM
jgi:hypothetical protein